MSSVHSISRNFHTNNYEEFLNEVGSHLGNHTLVKSWQVFNRCMTQPTESTSKTCNHSYPLLNLPDDNRELQQFLLSAADKGMSIQVGGDGSEGEQVTEDQVVLEILALPVESEERKQFIQKSLLSAEAQNYFSKDPQNVVKLTAFYDSQTKGLLNGETLLYREGVQ